VSLRGLVRPRYWIGAASGGRSSHVKPYNEASQDRERETRGDSEVTSDVYEQAVKDMIERTSTRQAAWTLIEAKDKYLARLKVLTTVCDRLESHLLSH
jgi:AMP-polyphosphate phosphotransferase